MIISLNLNHNHKVINMTLNQIIHSILNDQYTNEDLTKIASAISATRERLARVNTFNMRVGLNVTFTNKGVKHKGIVSKINRTTINVQTDKGIWKVPANMLTLEE